MNSKESNRTIGTQHTRTHLEIQDRELQLRVRQHLPEGGAGVRVEVAVRQVQLLQRRVCPQPPAQGRGTLAPKRRVVVQLEGQERLVAPDAERLPQSRSAAWDRSIFLVDASCTWGVSLRV